MKRRFASAIVCASLLTLAACSTGAPNTRSNTAGLPSTQQDVQGEQWSLNGAASKPTMPSDPSVTLGFSDRSIFGTGPCNSYRGTVSFHNMNSIDITNVSTTTKACSSSAQQVETEYLKALQSIHSANRSRDKLLLHGAQGVELVFEAQGLSKLLLETWNITAYATDAAIFRPILSTHPTIVFENASELTLDSGCGPSSGHWKLVGDLLSVFGLDSPPVCDQSPAISDQQHRMIEATESANRADISTSSLTIFDNHGLILLTAKKGT